MERVMGIPFDGNAVLAAVVTVPDKEPTALLSPQRPIVQPGIGHLKESHINPCGNRQRLSKLSAQMPRAVSLVGCVGSNFTAVEGQTRL